MSQYTPDDLEQKISDIFADAQSDQIYALKDWIESAIAKTIQDADMSNNLAVQAYFTPYIVGGLMVLMVLMFLFLIIRMKALQSEETIFQALVVVIVTPFVLTMAVSTSSNDFRMALIGLVGTIVGYTLKSYISPSQSGENNSSPVAPSDNAPQPMITKPQED
ncbi:hypothetical protein JCM17960_27040 [Magnetospira thiophila]